LKLFRNLFFIEKKNEKEIEIENRKINRIKKKENKPNGPAHSGHSEERRTCVAS
jgi:hypothetical protein